MQKIADQLGKSREQQIVLMHYIFIISTGTIQRFLIKRLGTRISEFRWPVRVCYKYKGLSPIHFEKYSIWFLFACALKLKTYLHAPTEIFVVLRWHSYICSLKWSATRVNTARVLTQTSLLRPAGKYWKEMLQFMVHAISGGSDSFIFHTFWPCHWVHIKVACVGACNIPYLNLCKVGTTVVAASVPHSRRSVCWYFGWGQCTSQTHEVPWSLASLLLHSIK